MTFIHKFSRSVQCRVEISDEPPEPGSIGDREYFWTGRPRRKHLPEYLRWSHEINRVLSDLWHHKILHCYMVERSPAKWQFWSYSPGLPPKLVKIGDEPEEPFTEANHSAIFDVDEDED